ncbi:MAG: hypothetical protein ACD_79C00133G0004 [uncultured bacterium]|nr:MAG: hypothetical protein ACD_79C00133G0004 [uncultured bacterium]
MDKISDLGSMGSLQQTEAQSKLILEQGQKLNQIKSNEEGIKQGIEAAIKAGTEGGNATNLPKEENKGNMIDLLA